ncbi:MAG: alpha/beta fold hydrolase [Micromonosporaceae bacterium]
MTSDAVRSADGTSIGYERAGTGPALILVDAAQCFRGFGPSAELGALLTPYFTVFRYDRRGRGESTDTTPYAVRREVEDLAALIGAAGGSAYLYGFSSGAVLALLAAAEGLNVTKLGLLEPPWQPGEPDPDEPGLGAEVAALVAAGRRGDAVEHFNSSIGVPAEMVAGLRQSPSWPALEALAHTLEYDSTITRSLPAERLATITTPALVINSEASDDRLLGWGKGVADTMPNATYRVMKGEWHGVPAPDLARTLTDYFA